MPGILNYFFFSLKSQILEEKKGKLKKNESLLTLQLLMQHILFKGNLSCGAGLDNSNCFYLSIRIFYEAVLKKEENTQDWKKYVVFTMNLKKTDQGPCCVWLTLINFCGCRSPDLEEVSMRGASPIDNVDSRDDPAAQREERLEKQRRENQFHQYVQGNLILKQGFVDKRKVRNRRFWPRQSENKINDGAALEVLSGKKK